MRGNRLSVLHQGAIGLELWSMSSDIMFDNFIITDDKAVADDYASQTWKLKKAVRARNEVEKDSLLLISLLCVR